MKNQEMCKEQGRYTVTADEFAGELLPLVKDFFTAEAEVAENGTLNVSSTNGEKFPISVQKAEYRSQQTEAPCRRICGRALSAFRRYCAAILFLDAGTNRGKHRCRNGASKFSPIKKNSGHKNIKNFFGKIIYLSFNHML